ncbi:hypothetical protein BJY16_006661 [Actinoplanes octamycinicus]|uniref:PH (Pleckstrin Homology) domain-containing protein n=1 Tax=Actinoplanes octamycinicus TaxID=135948 RepID=A0A7W7H3H5_9ACTN|nr:PH domain-containing protein [Actinoplanes octamycinicus]MBB4743202.1 hypothetical protein [Actinoplanes octamycinicus]GIE61234.1 hypothetical protein Aoc01nite_66360 [Actinoplanes octamycinicus]
METDLLPGERVLWQGRPQRHRLFRRTDLTLVPFSLLWCGFAIFWETSVILSGGPTLLKLWGIPFVLIGLYLVAGRFVVRAVASRRTRYTITTNRVLVHGGWSGTRLTTAYLKSLPPPVVTERPDGSGDLAFGALPGPTDVFTTTHRRNGWRAWSTEPSTTPVLWDIPDVRLVRDFAAHAQSAA